MDIELPISWKEKLYPAFEKDYFQTLIAFVKQAYQQHEVFPAEGMIFEAFKYCSFNDVKVVIIGQDPYHGPNQAHGLAFSVPEGVKIPPSLNNIFKEIKEDLHKPIPKNGNLERWARQGVLLLNATLTVRANSPGSHHGKGWEIFTDAVIETISSEKEQVVFMLWGANAQGKTKLIDESKHLVLQSAHPSPLSAYRGFFGNHHFSKANAYLVKNGKAAIDW